MRMGVERRGGPGAEIEYKFTFHYPLPAAETMAGAEFGGRTKISRTKISEWRFFPEKISIFTRKIFFLIDLVFHIFLCLL